DTGTTSLRCAPELTGADVEDASDGAALLVVQALQEMQLGARLRAFDGRRSRRGAGRGDNPRPLELPVATARSAALEGNCGQVGRIAKNGPIRHRSFLNLHDGPFRSHQRGHDDVLQ